MHCQVKMKKEKGKNEETREPFGAVGEKIWNIRDRSFAFAVRIVKLCQYLEKRDLVSRTLVRQLLRSATSVGANLEESQAGQSKPDFISKNAIALKEARNRTTGYDYSYLRMSSILRLGSVSKNCETNLVK